MLRLHTVRWRFMSWGDIRVQGDHIMQMMALLFRVPSLKTRHRGLDSRSQESQTSHGSQKDSSLVVLSWIGCHVGGKKKRKNEQPLHIARWLFENHTSCLWALMMASHLVPFSWAAVLLWSHETRIVWWVIVSDLMSVSQTSSNWDGSWGCNGQKSTKLKKLNVWCERVKIFYK